jgi:hypothetical protein
MESFAVLSALSMRRKLSIITMLTAWLLATGSHWDLVQTFAWGRMIATYSQSMSLAQAVKLTFTPDNLRGVCESVSEAKQHENTAIPSDAKAPGKILLVFQPAPAFHPAWPVIGTWPVGALIPVYRDRAPPSLRPPRALV